MLEYVSDAVVLNKEPNGDMDVRVSLFTKKFGKLKVRAKSARKITSKLSPHLEPGNLVAVRIVEKSGLQVVDALKRLRLPHAPADFFALDGLLHEYEPDAALWNTLVGEKFEWRNVLKHLGWDPEHGACRLCGMRNPDFFDTRSQEFVCAACLTNNAKPEAFIALRRSAEA